MWVTRSISHQVAHRVSAESAESHRRYGFQVERVGADDDQRADSIKAGRHRQHEKENNSLLLELPFLSSQAKFVGRFKVVPRVMTTATVRLRIFVLAHTGTP
jgi:hypothetical protein